MMANSSAREYSGTESDVSRGPPRTFHEPAHGGGTAEVSRKPKIYSWMCSKPRSRSDLMYPTLSAMKITAEESCDALRRSNSLLVRSLMCSIVALTWSTSSGGGSSRAPDEPSCRGLRIEVHLGLHAREDSCPPLAGTICCVSSCPSRVVNTCFWFIFYFTLKLQTFFQDHF